MKCRFYFITLLSTVCCFLSVHTGLAAVDTQEWRDRVTQVAEESTLSDSLKVIRISDLCYNYFYYYRVFDKSNLDEYFQLVEPLAQVSSSDDLFSYIYGTALIMVRDDSVKQEINRKCILHTEKCHNPLIAARSWQHLGRKHIQESAALDYFFRGLKVLEGTDENAAISGLYQYIAMYYSLQGDKDNETKYARQALDAALLSDDARAIMNAWQSIAESHFFREDYPAAIEAYNKARKMYTERLEPDEKDPDLRYIDGLNYMVIGVNLGSMHYHDGQLETAADIMNEALSTARRLNQVETEAYSLKELGRIYLDMKQYRKAEEHFLETERLLSTEYVNTAESKYIAYEVELALANLYDITGQYRKSAEYYKSGIEKYRDLHDEEQMEQNQQQAALYETQKQEEEIERRETIVAYHERQKWLYAGILIVIITALFFVAKIYNARIKHARRKEKNLRAKARMLEKEKRKTELDSELKQKEADSLREKLTLGNSLREQHNKTLEDINTFLTGHPELNEYRHQLKSIMLQQTRIDNNVDEFKSGMNGVPLDFYIKLQKIADNKLSSLDLKYCRLLYLDTPTRDMAELLSVEPKTVRMQKYRLKQKLSLDKDDDLLAFIQQITEDKNGTA